MILNDTSFKRDPDSGVLINTNADELKRILSDRQNSVEMNKIYSDFCEMKKEFETLKRLMKKA